MQVYVAEHLPKIERIQLGSYYTPEKLVQLVHEFIKPYLKNKKKDVILFDSAGGCGSFLFGLKDYNYRIADYDSEACSFLKQHFDSSNIFHTNSLIEVERVKYFISPSAFLITIGNPPYNDTTSEFKNGEKGKNICDADLYDRDIGISFLRSYHKLNADVVCILHPLSYLIKEANFKRLRDFRDNYRLIKGEVFSSALFRGTGTTKFPILIALYEKNPRGVTFDYIQNFQFSMLNDDREFVLSKYKTTDGYINKYPPRKSDVKESPIGLYYYTFRDFNSLKKNASFMLKKHPNGIVVTLENFYKYAYLYSLKSLFNPENAWLYGNLSPLVDVEELEKDKHLYVLYALGTSPIFSKIKRSIRDRLLQFYNIKSSQKDINQIKEMIKSRLNKLV